MPNQTNTAIFETEAVMLLWQCYLVSQVAVMDESGTKCIGD